MFTYRPGESENEKVQADMREARRRRLRRT
jgi:hypothetical protein